MQIFSKFLNKIIFLSDHILGSKWPCFAIPIHMCHPVEAKRIHFTLKCFTNYIHSTAIAGGKL